MVTFRSISLCLILVAAPFGATGCGGPESRGPESGSPKLDFEREGNASWYGRAFQGKQTANGERFDMHALTAAHRTLPFGTVLEVTNLSNDKSVRVRVNDRGPYAKSRILDLSRSAAMRLDMIEAGIVRIKIRIVDSGKR